MTTTILEDVLIETKKKLKLKDRIIIILSSLLILSLSITIYLTYHVYKNNQPHEKIINYHKELIIEIKSDELKTNKNAINKKRRKLVKVT